MSERPRPGDDRQPNPYDALPPTAFWRTGVAEPGVSGLTGLWASKWTLPADARFATFGSCFAQHISRALRARGMNWLNAEPAPARTPPKLAEDYNYGIFSARTGNIYTAAQLLTHVRMAAGELDPDSLEIWPERRRFVDSIRPAIEPGGFASEADLRLSRGAMVRAFRRTITEAEVFVFTLGLTEGWDNAETGQCYALCPGTVAGTFDPSRHRFRNFTYPEIRADLDRAFALMWAMNPDLRILLTVSPVPLTATASGDHVLVATTWSKAVLRAVAGDLAALDARIDYFPSFEIITGAPSRGAFFAANLRSVTAEGVSLVMSHFFAGLDTGAAAVRAPDTDLSDRTRRMEAAMEAEDLVCEEMVLESFNAS